MKRLIKYRRLCVIIMLIVLMISNVNVYAKIDMPATQITGIGTSADPYILDFSREKKIIVKAETVPFYFTVQGTGGLGGVFVVEYDVENKLVSFLFDRTVAKADSNEINVPLNEGEYKTHVHQLGIQTKQANKSDTTIPRYDISEVIDYDATNVDGNIVKNTSEYINSRGSYSPSIIIENGNKDKKTSRVTRTMKLANTSVGNSSEIAGSKYNIYFFANQTNTESDVCNLFEGTGYFKSTIDRVQNYHGTNLSETHTVFSKEGFNYVVMGTKIDLNILYKFNGMNNSLGDQGEPSELESLFTRLLLAFGDVLLDMISHIFGKKLTINSLIFNTYEDTKLNFYSSKPSGLSAGLAEVVNTWYEIFSKLAYVLYVIILVYIGIMLVASAGTDEQDKKEKSLGDWFAGLAIMFVVPTFVIPSLIKLNDAFVTFMRRQNGEEITTYYNYYEVGDDILGGDSATVSIEKLMEMREKESNELKELREEMESMFNNYVDLIVSTVQNETGYVATPKEKELLYNNFNSVYSSLKFHSNTKQGEELEKEIPEILKWAEYTIIAYGPDNRIGSNQMHGSLCQEARNYFKIGSPQCTEMTNLFLSVVEKELKIDIITDLIKIKQTDLMTVMRSYAGQYERIIFAVVWLLLIFQMIAMVFIYYKRIFVIAILITIFPLIMIFYCIDKMADGSAQTLSMWFKELIADIFIQSIHCVMYVVLVQMGLEIYKNDPNNWFLFLAAMLLLVPAERMMKEIFGLNSSTLGQLGGIGMSIAMGIGAAVKLGKMGTGKLGDIANGRRDKAFVQKQNARFKKIQNKQTRADTRAAISQNKRLAKGKEPSKQRLYHAATNLRKAEAKVMPIAATVAKIGKEAATTTAALSYGAYKAISGEGMSGLYAGVSIAEKASGVGNTKVSGKNATIKKELNCAYKRKKKRNNASNNTTNGTSNS